MSLLFISIGVGIFAAGLVWLDHVVIRQQDQDEIDRSFIMKGFLIGFMSSYIGGSFVNVGDKNVVTSTIESISDSMKTGRPTF